MQFPIYKIQKNYEIDEKWNSGLVDQEGLVHPICTGELSKAISLVSTSKGKKEWWLQYQV